MKNRVTAHISISVVALISLIVGILKGINFNSEELYSSRILGLSLMFALLCAMVCIIMDFLGSITDGSIEEWKDLLFFLRKYDRNEKNQHIYDMYCKDFSTKRPPLIKIWKINVAYSKQNSRGGFWYIDAIKPYIEILGVALVAFAWSFGIQNIMMYWIASCSLYVMFWISIGILALGLLGRCLFSEYPGSDVNIICAIINGAVVVALAIALATTGIVRHSNVKKYERYSSDNIIIAITDKNENSNRIGLDFENKSALGITFMQGVLRMYDTTDTQILETRIDFNGIMPSGEKKTFTIDINNYTKEFYKKPIKYMYATFKLESVTFDNGKTKEYDVEAIKVLELAETKEPSKFENLSVGSEIEFGGFELNKNFDDGYEDIPWIVVAVDGNKVCLLSKYLLISMPFAPVEDGDYASWAQSDIRAYLNGKFYMCAFSSDERSLIVPTTLTPTEEEFNMGAVVTMDKVYIPSCKEMELWFSSKFDMQCYSKGNIYSGYTDDGIGSTSYADYNNYDDYWLREAYIDDYWWYEQPTICYYDTAYNDIYGTGFTTYDSKGIRPVIWIDLSLLNE